MDTNFILLIVTLLVPAITLVGLMLCRAHTSRNEDDFLRVNHPTSSTLNNQAATAQEMDVLERWVTVLISAVLVCGLGMGAWFLYQVWQANSKLVS